MTKQQLIGIVRHALTMAGGLAISKGVTTSTDWEMYSGSAIALVGVIWSVLNKKPAKRKADKS